MAFNYLKSDMVYVDYSWTIFRNDDPKITGHPDDVLLNRKEGYEVLPFINRFAERYKLENKSDGNKIEKMIREKLPSDIRSRRNIALWLVENWLK